MLIVRAYLIYPKVKRKPAGIDAAGFTVIIF